jgi:pyruvate kinase
MIVGLYKQGVNIIRLNFSHKDYQEKQKVIQLVHDLNTQGITKLSLLMDTKGPEIRTGAKTQHSLYTQWQDIKLTTRIDDCGIDDLYCDYPYLLQDINIWDIIKIDSGLFDVEVKTIHDNYCIVRALQDARIWSHRHINLPGKKLKLTAMSEQDQQDLLFGIHNGIHIVAMSFVRSAQDIDDLRNFWSMHGGGSVCIFAKIENMEGMQHIQSIVQHSDGIMVARGDLGIEADISLIPIYQQTIVKTCHHYGKPVIIATQMIESMMTQPFPTRAEIQDIAHAVQRGVDAVMLSGETAIGKYPLQAVSHMAHTIDMIQTHDPLPHPEVCDDGRDDKWLVYKHLINSAIQLADQIDAQAILIFTKTGAGAKIVSSYKPHQPVVVCTRDKIVADNLRMYYSIYPVVLQQKIVNLDHTQASKLIYDASITPSKQHIVCISDVDVISGHHPTIQVISCQ